MFYELKLKYDVLSITFHIYRYVRTCIYNCGSPWVEIEHYSIAQFNRDIGFEAL